MKLTPEEFSHIPRHAVPHVVRRISALGIGQKMQDLPVSLWHESFKKYVNDETRKGGPNLRLFRLDPDQPSLTVTGFIFNKFVHPFEPRFISPREAARLQGFPDSYLFKGCRTSVQRQVGNAVPTQLARAVAGVILQHIVNHHPRGLGTSVYKDGVFPAISMFSGAGGLDIGVSGAKHKDSGFHFSTQVDIEIDHDCCETLRFNNKGKNLQVIEKSITACDMLEVKKGCHLQRGILPLVYGGPPCQAFSQAAKRTATDDPRGELIFSYLDAIDKLKPVYFILENVANLRGICEGKLFKSILKRIDDMNYSAVPALLNAADYGAPQKRKRIVLIGVQKPFPSVQPPFPTHGEGIGQKPFVTVREAFAGLPPAPKWP